MLPRQWKGVNLWAVYGDFLTGVADKKETGGYCGSGTNALEGVQARLRDYSNIVHKDKKPDKLKHAEWLVRARNGEVEMNLRPFAVFNQCTTGKPYVLLMELLSTILLQTLPDTPGSGPYRPRSVVEMVRQAKPHDLPVVTYTRLNGAAQCRQGMAVKRKPGTEVCVNCGTTEMSIGHHWHSAEPGLPFTGLICGPCHSYRRANNGNERPREHETRRLHLIQLEGAIGPKPPPGTPCPGCGSQVSAWLLPKGDHASETARERWECRNCSRKATNQLGRKNSGTPAKDSARAEMLRRVGAKPGAGTECPGCDRPNEKQWLLPKGDLALEPIRFRWECSTCYAKATPKLQDRRKQKPRA